MWILIIMAYAFAYDGGAHVNMTTIEMGSKSACIAAKTEISQSYTKLNFDGKWTGGYYQVIAKCIKSN